MSEPKTLLKISANKVFSPPINSPKSLTVYVDPETTTCSDVQTFVFDEFEKFEEFIPSCASELNLTGRNTSAFGMKDDSIISKSIHPDMQTDCSRDIISLDVTLNQGLPGGAANVEEEEEWFIVRSNQREESIHFKSFRLSCSSHVYSPENRYAGIVLYAYTDGETKWELNKHHYKSGYTVILNTQELLNLSREEGWPETEGTVHGLVFYYLFRCEIGQSIGEGFAIMNGDVKWNSTTFNARGDSYHDGQRIISESGKKMIDKLIREWKRYGDEYGSIPPNSCLTFE